MAGGKRKSGGGGGSGVGGNGGNAGNQGGKSGANNAQVFDFGGKSNSGKPVALSQGAQAALLPLLQKQMNTLVGKSSGYFESLPRTVQKRVRALKKLQAQHDKMDEEFRKEQEALEKKYETLKNPLYNRRSDIVNGAYEPTEEETAEEETEEKKEEKKEEKEETKEEKEVKGVPDFWLEVLRHQDDFGEVISKEDEPILRHLIDIKWTPVANEEKPTPSFVLEFHFTPNDYFEEQILKKTYYLVEDPQFDDVMFDRAEGTDIKWKAGKNVTVKMVTKKQPVGGKRGGKRGGGRSQQTKTITVEEPVKSFFHFFETVSAEDDEEMEEEDLQEVLESDYEMAVIIKSSLIPDAVKWYTGEVPQMGMDDDEDGDEEDGDEEDGDEEGGEYKSEDDDDFDPKADPAKGGAQQECKQQ